MHCPASSDPRSARRELPRILIIEPASCQQFLDVPRRNANPPACLPEILRQGRIPVSPPWIAKPREVDRVDRSLHSPNYRTAIGPLRSLQRVRKPLSKRLVVLKQKA